VNLPESNVDYRNIPSSMTVVGKSALNSSSAKVQLEDYTLPSGLKCVKGKLKSKNFRVHYFKIVGLSHRVHFCCADFPTQRISFGHIFNSFGSDL